MTEESMKQVAAVIAGKRTNLTIDGARELAKRALKFKQERDRLPSITSPDAWEKRTAEGVAFLTRMKAEAPRGYAAQRASTATGSRSVLRTTQRGERAKRRGNSLRCSIS